MSNRSRGPKNIKHVFGHFGDVQTRFGGIEWRRASPKRYLLPTSMATPFRQVRADYDDETITVYQAYNRAIASAAVAKQKLNASPEFLTTRMTWIKPSWAWMLY